MKTSDETLLQYRTNDDTQVGPCHYGTALPQDAVGGDLLQLWKVAGNILNQKSRTADKGRRSSSRIGGGANNCLP